MACCKDTNNTSSSQPCACASKLSPALVRLPPRSPIENSSKPPVWAITNVEGDRPTPTEDGESAPLLAPLPAKCARHTDERLGVCCKELKGDDERTLIDPDVVRDM